MLYNYCLVNFSSCSFILVYIQTLIKITDERMQKLSTFRGERRRRDKEEDRGGGERN